MHKTKDDNDSQSAENEMENIRKLQRQKESCQIYINYKIYEYWVDDATSVKDIDRSS